MTLRPQTACLCLLICLNYGTHFSKVGIVGILACVCIHIYTHVYNILKMAVFPEDSQAQLWKVVQ